MLLKKISFASMGIFFAIIGFAGGAFAKVYVDIDSPAFKQIPIAISDFNEQTAGGKGASVADGIGRDLALTGLFNILNKKSFLEDKDSVKATSASGIRFADWAAIGADYLVRGNVASGGKELSAELFLFDVTRGEMIFHKKYQAGQDGLKTMCRVMASDMMRVLINDEGDFSTQIAFVSKSGLKSDIYSVNYDGSEIKRITRHETIVMAPRWSPDGRLLAFTSFKRGRPEVYIKNLRDGTEKRVAFFDGLNLCGGFSPDSKKLLLTLSKDGNEKIYVMDIETLSLKRLTHNYSIDVSPSWSPDGKKIVFVSSRSGSPQIYTMAADGDNVKRISFSGNYNTSPSWSPRGDRIAYEGLTNGRYQIFSTDPDGGNTAQLTGDTANNESPSWSPSGRQIVYSSQKGSRGKIIMMNSNGSNPRLLVERDNKLVMPSWSPRFR